MTITKNQVSPSITLNKTQHEIFTNEVAQASPLLRYAHKLERSPNGAVVKYNKTRPVASWVGENEVKPTTSFENDAVSMSPKTLVALFEITRQAAADYGIDEKTGTIRNNSLLGYIKSSMATATTEALIEGTLGTGGLADATTVAYDGTNLLLALADAKRVGRSENARFIADIDLEYEAIVNSQAAGQNQAIWIPSVADTDEFSQKGRILGRPAIIADLDPAAPQGAPRDPDALAYYGDWDNLVWAQNSPLEILVSAEGTLVVDGQVHSAIQRNSLIVRAEMELLLGVVNGSSFAAVRRTEEEAPETPETP